MTKQEKTRDILMVRWVDSSFQMGWRSLDEMRQELAEILSVGILAKQNKKMIVLMMSYDSSNDKFADGIVIPRCSIKHVEKIGEASNGN